MKRHPVFLLMKTTSHSGTPEAADKIRQEVTDIEKAAAADYGLVTTMIVSCEAKPELAPEAMTKFGLFASAVTRWAMRLGDLEAQLSSLEKRAVNQGGGAAA